MSAAPTSDLHPFAVVVPLPRETAFNFLADVENFPRWGAEFCERLEISRGRWLALTSAGELFVEVEADAHSGVVDLRAGEEHAVLFVLSLRVLAAPTGGSIIQGVLNREARQSAAEFAARCGCFEGALRRLGERIDRRAPSVACNWNWARVA